MKRTHYVYITRGECGRFYIGVRSCKGDPNNDSYMGSHQNKTYHPIEKWVWSEFNTREEAENAEASLHELFDVAFNPYFSNLAKAQGWGGNYGWTHREETKKMMSITRRGDRNPAKRLEVRQKLSSALRGNQCAKGVVRSEETKAKMAKAKIGDNNPAKRPDVRQRNSEAQKRMRWCYNPETGDTRRFLAGSSPPAGFQPGRGPRVKES